MKYTIRVWLFTLITSEILLMIFDLKIYSWKSTNLTDYLLIPLLMLLLGTSLSFPAMSLFWVIKQKFSDKLSNIKLKLILSLYSFFSVWITFYILDKGFIENNFKQISWPLIYSSAIVIGVWVLKLKKDDNNKINHQN